MANRWTDPEKWAKPWFRKLPPKAKLLWIYLVDCCDKAGVWPADFELASFRIGTEVTRADFDEVFGSRAIWLEEDKVFLPCFIEFQYGKLSEACKPHLSVMRELEKHGINPSSLMPYPKGTDSLSVAYPMGTDTLENKNKNKIGFKNEEERENVAEATSGAAHENSAPARAPELPAKAPRPPAAPNPSPAPTSPNPAPTGSLADQVAACCETWLGTLEHFGDPRKKTAAAEQLEITRAIQANDFESVELALFGARYEPPSKDGSWHPKDWIDITRVLTKDKQGRPRIQKFMGYGSKARAKLRAEEDKRRQEEIESRILEADHSEMPEELRKRFGITAKPAPEPESAPDFGDDPAAIGAAIDSALGRRTG